MSRNEKAEAYLYRGEAFAFGGYLTNPVYENLETQAPSVLSPTGGYSSARAEDFRYREFFSFSRATTQVIGTYNEREVEFNTLMSATIENLNILNMVTADLVSCRLSITYKGDPSQPEKPSVNPAGSFFMNLRVGGKPFDPDVPSALGTIAPKSEMADLWPSCERTPMANGAGPHLARNELLQKGPLVIPQFGSIYHCGLARRRVCAPPDDVADRAGMYPGRENFGSGCRQWEWRMAFNLTARALVLLLLLVACRGRPPTTEALFQDARKAFNTGDLELATRLAEQGFDRRDSPPESLWHYRFLLLKSEILYAQGKKDDALALLPRTIPDDSAFIEIKIRSLIIQARVQYLIRQYQAADHLLTQANRLAQENGSTLLLAEVALRRGYLHSLQKNFAAAEECYRLATSGALAAGDPFLQIEAARKPWIQPVAKLQVRRSHPEVRTCLESGGRGRRSKVRRAQLGKPRHLLLPAGRL